MTVEQHIKDGAIQKVCHLHNGIFNSINLTCITLSQFYFITSLVLHSRKTTDYRMREKNILINLAASAYYVTSKEVENRVFRHNRIFRQTCMHKQPIFTKSWNFNNFVQILYSYLRGIDKLLDVFFFLLAVILSELHENPRRKN